MTRGKIGEEKGLRAQTLVLNYLKRLKVTEVTNRKMKTNRLNWFLYIIGYYKWKWERQIMVTEVTNRKRKEK